MSGCGLLRNLLRFQAFHHPCTSGAAHRGTVSGRATSAFRPPYQGENMALTRLEKAQAWLFKSLSEIVFMIFRFFSPRKPAASGKKLPPVSSPLLLLSATQLAKKIRRKEVCSRSKETEKHLARRLWSKASFCSCGLFCFQCQTHAVS